VGLIWSTIRRVTFAYVRFALSPVATFVMAMLMCSPLLFIISAIGPWQITTFAVLVTFLFAADVARIVRKETRGTD
jgi:ABC-type dipeptide/oligopeptide/nickel transport system permease subunit